MLRFDTLFLVNGGDAVAVAIGGAAVMHWQNIPPDVRIAIVKTADLIEPLRKDRGSDVHRTSRTEGSRRRDR